MTKDNYPEKISQWLDNDLTSQEVSELKAHLVHCSMCRQTYESMQRVDRLLHAAGEQMVVPSLGFPRRFESRLARYEAHKPWQLWLALSALLVGTLLFSGVWIVGGGLALVNSGYAALDADVMYQGLLTVIQSTASFRTAFNITLLIWKTALMITSQPMFWLLTLAAICATWLWVRVLQMLSRRTAEPIELML